MYVLVAGTLCAPCVDAQVGYWATGSGEKHSAFPNQHEGSGVALPPSGGLVLSSSGVGGVGGVKKIRRPDHEIRGKLNFPCGFVTICIKIKIKITSTGTSGLMMGQKAQRRVMQKLQNTHEESLDPRRW